MARGSEVRNADLVRAILDQACGRREFLILVTPYLRFESHFLALEGDAFHVSATMSREDAMYGLRNADLRFRFPNGVSFMEGHTHMLGLGLADGRRSLKLSLPKALAEDEQRGAYRVERVGRVTATVSTKRFEILTASLVNISSTGARLLAPRDLTPDFMQPGDEITITIPLTDDIRINGKALVRHLDSRNFGLEFHPHLEDPEQTKLSRWVFQKREEDKDRVTRRGAEVLPPGAHVATGARAVEPSGILLVSGNPELEAELRDVLLSVQPLTRVEPHVQGLKEGLAAAPMLALFDVPSLGLDQRRRLKSLVEAASGKLPFMILGAPGLDMSPLLELGTEMRASATYQWGPGKGAFFQRLVQGILRRHYEGAEGPMAPKEAEQG